VLVGVMCVGWCDVCWFRVIHRLRQLACGEHSCA